MSEKGFLSFGHADKKAVAQLFKWIEARGLPLWYSLLMKPGSYEDQITNHIHSCSVFIAIITEAGAGRDSSGWVLREIMEADDAGRVIFPCVIGNFKLGQEMRRLIDTKHQVKAARIEDLPGDEGFRFCIDALIADLKEDTSVAFSENWARKSREGVTAWYAGPPSFEDQALSLAIASLPDMQADLVTLAAQDLTEMIAGQLRALTEEEQAAAPRTIGAESLSERLARVRAERVRISDQEAERPIDVIRFTAPRWNYDLLDHVWTEREDVRRIYVDWLAKIATDQQTQGLGRYAAQTIGVLARKHLASIQVMVLSDWLDMEDPERFRDLVPLIGDVLRAAVEDRHNVAEATRILLDLAQVPRRKGQLVTGQQAALWIALGPTGLRRPGLAVSVMKALGWQIFRDDNFKIVTRSPAFYGAQTLEDAKIEGGAGQGAPEDAAETGAQPSDAETPATGDTNAEDAGTDAEPSPGAAEMPKAAASAALPAMEFIAALADWADEPLKARTRAEAEDGKLRRQVPLAALLLIFNGMPLLSRRKSNRLTLEELMRIGAQWDKDLLERIIAGLRRAGMATKYRGDRSPYFAQHYFPPHHLATMFYGFARERWREETGQGLAKDDRPDPDQQYPGDPLLDFAALVYAEIDRADRRAERPRGTADKAVHKMKRHLLQQEMKTVTEPAAQDATEGAPT